ncbi:cupin domain-containing protein [Rubrivirga sp. IMCC45206]|uniref:cupin domain-containing protein n=1 Tax=Rubrivirga sp. IMCC45206 TaxID=3391614 RepID=UPI00398FE096
MESSIQGSGPFVKAAEVEWEAPDPGVTRQVLGYDGELMLVRVLFETGAVGTPHAHPHRQVSYVCKGAFDVTIDGVTTTLGEGDSFFVEPDLVHGAVCTEAGELLDVFAPARETFVPPGG